MVEPGGYRDCDAPRPDAELAGRLSQMQSTGLASVMTKQLSAALKSPNEMVASTQQIPQTDAANIAQLNSSNNATKALQPALNMPQLSNTVPE